MKIIRTLAGDLPAEQFGIIDYHEHVIARPPVEKPNDIDLSLSDVDTMAKELENFARAGGSLLVDASTADFGDNAHLRLEISQKAGVPVVGTVGFGQKEHHTEAVKNSSVEELYARVTKAVREGYGSQNLRPGQLKFGTSYIICRKFFTAFSSAAGTGIPLQRGSLPHIPAPTTDVEKSLQNFLPAQPAPIQPYEQKANSLQSSETLRLQGSDQTRPLRAMQKDS